MLPPIPSRIHPLHSTTTTSSSAAHEPEDPIDIFALALSSGTLFPDHPITSHGDPGGRIGYTSPTFGELVLDIPQHPDGEVGRGLFAHYLWSAAAVAAAAVEQGSLGEAKGEGWWDVRGRRVLEVGAGTALPSLIAALSSASSIYITDHPASPALTSGSIVSNVKQNIFPTPDGPGPLQRDATAPPAERIPKTKAEIHVLPHVWGQLTAESAQQLRSSFDKVIVADCLWMSSQHESLISSILHFLKPISSAQEDRRQAESSPSAGKSNPEVSNQSYPVGPSKPCALVVAGFHTGRTILAWFFSKATDRGLVIEEIWEVDLGNLNRSDELSNSDTAADESSGETRGASGLGNIQNDGVRGRRRPWLPNREGESKEDAKRWCVVAVLTKPEETAQRGINEAGHEASSQSRPSPDSALKEDKPGPAEGTLEVHDIGWV